MNNVLDGKGEERGCLVCRGRYVNGHPKDVVGELVPVLITHATKNGAAILSSEATITVLYFRDCSSPERNWMVQ